MDPNAGNPYMQGANPFMQGQPGGGTPPPVSPGDVMGGMGGGSSETTKPRQMPGGPDVGSMGMPAPAGGSSDIPGAAPSPSVPGAPSATPDQPPSAGSMTQTGALIREVRRDVATSNPDLTMDQVHVVAMRVVALISEAAPQPNHPWIDPNPRAQQNQQGRGFRRGRQRLPQGDTGDRRDPNSVMHPNHPQHQDYFPNAQQHQPQVDKDGNPLWTSQHGGRTPLEDRAFAKGYQGRNPNLFGLGDALVQMYKTRKNPDRPKPNQEVDQ